MRKPSDEKIAYWLFARAPRPSLGHNSGKWLVFGSSQEIDALWPIVAQATLTGKLGPQSKVSTAKPSPHGNDGQAVICVYCADSDCLEVIGIRYILRGLGVTKPLRYKRDAATRAGKYGFGSSETEEEVKNRLSL